MTDTGFSLNVFGHSDKGLFRKNNQDYFHILANLFIVADGLGGHNAGEVASKLAVENIAEKIQLLHEVELDELQAKIVSLVKETSKHVFETSLQNPEQKGMGTTIASVWIHKNQCAIFHVGDSRVYRYRNGTLSLITKDHANEVSIDEDQLGEIRRRYLTQAIGTTVDCEARIHVEEIVSHDRYIVCSDGLTDYVTTKEMELLLLKNSDSEKATHALINAALSRGSRDNVTAIVLNILPTPVESSNCP